MGRRPKAINNLSLYLLYTDLLQFGKNCIISQLKKNSYTYFIAVTIILMPGAGTNRWSSRSGRCRGWRTEACSRVLTDILVGHRTAGPNPQPLPGTLGLHHYASGRLSDCMKKCIIFLNLNKAGIHSINIRISQFIYACRKFFPLPEQFFLWKSIAIVPAIEL